MYQQFHQQKKAAYEHDFFDERDRQFLGWQPLFTIYQPFVVLVPSSSSESSPFLRPVSSRLT